METSLFEVALIEIKAGQQAAFEAVFPDAERIISQADGYRSHTMERCIETDNRYLLRVSWASLESHTIGFRQSELFQQWRAIIGPFFASPPVVEHYRPI
jgi:heme-degrading monooxygenase HmoA